MNKEKFKVKIEKIVDDYSNCSLIDVDAISEEAYELALTLTDVSSMFSAEQMEKAFDDGIKSEQQRCGEFDIENYC